MDEQRARSSDGAAETAVAALATLTASVVVVLPVADVVSLLAGSASGLSEAKAASRLRRFGPNTIAARPRKPLLPRLLYARVLRE